MLNEAEVRFLATLVQKGHIPKEAAEKVFQNAAQATGLDDLLVEQGLFDRKRLAFLRTTGGEDVPEIPGYDYVANAGFGGTSWVFHGCEKASGKDVAIKIMHRELHADDVQRRRFVHEARLLMKLDHTNIVKGLRVGHVKESSGAERLIFIMQWIPARTVLELQREGKEFEEDLALYIILQTAKALVYLHGNGVLHRDIKPDNILLTSDSIVKLIDLGFATMMDEPEGTADDTTLGTAAYMSPEQAQGTNDLDVRSDIYSLGATLYQIMVGELPFSGEGTQEQLAARILEALSSPELQSRRISPHMNYFIRKMMEQDRDFRYADVETLIGDIEEQIRGKKTLSFNLDQDAQDETLLGDLGEPGRNEQPDNPPPRKFPKRRRRR